MIKLYLAEFLLVAFIFINGCAHITENVKIFWGSSLKSLDNVKDSAVVKSYKCSYDDCFNKVLEILEENNVRVFMQEKVQGVIVAMEIKLSVSTTEAGIFFSEKGEDVIIEVASGSKKAKRILSELIFSKLDQAYNVKGELGQ